MTCILEDSLLNCNDLPVGGAYNFVMNYIYEEWRDMVEAGNVTFDADGRIIDIVNATGVEAYRFDQPDETALVLGSTDRLNDGGLDAFDHTFNMSILNTKQTQKNMLKVLSFKKVVCVIYRKNGTGEVYGGEQGLKPTANTYNPNDPALGTVIPVQMATSTRTPAESSPPADVFKTDAATTKALIEGLSTPG
jgi:hypothetical protein